MVFRKELSSMRMKKCVLLFLPLIISFLVIRFGLFCLYNSNDAPYIALLPAVIGITIAFITDGNVITYGTAFGYLISFFIAQTLKKDFIDPSHGNTIRNNWFELWIASYSIIISLCIVIDYLKQKYTIKYSDTSNN